MTVESNSDAGIKCGTIYRPSDLGGAEKYPASQFASWMRSRASRLRKEAEKQTDKPERQEKPAEKPQ